MTTRNGRAGRGPGACDEPGRASCARSSTSRRASTRSPSIGRGDAPRGAARRRASTSPTRRAMNVYFLPASVARARYPNAVHRRHARRPRTSGSCAPTTTGVRAAAAAAATSRRSVGTWNLEGADVRPRRPLHVARLTGAAVGLLSAGSTTALVAPSPCSRHRTPRARSLVPAVPLVPPRGREPPASHATGERCDSVCRRLRVKKRNFCVCASMPGSRVPVSPLGVARTS